jgi:hypothetical protein
MEAFRVNYQWRTAVVKDSGAYCFPQRFTPDFRQTYSHAAVYRWRLMRISGEQKEPIYIGEAEDVVRRIQRVIAPAKKEKPGDTNYRLNRIFKDYAATGRTVVLDIADIEPFEINGHSYGRGTLGDRFKRRALENLLLVDAVEDCRYELLNIAVDPVEKVRAAIAMLPPNVIREIAKKYAPESLGK